MSVALIAVAALLADPAVPQPSAPASPPQPADSPSLWFRNDDYPVAALREREQGTTAFTVTVGPDGAPTACAVTASSGSATLDSATCSLMMERARFTPARASDGRPVSGGWASRFRWRLPPLDPPSGPAVSGTPAFAQVRPGNPQSWLAEGDYPRDALRLRQQGVVGYRVAVGADGRPTACAITASSGFPVLDQATCRLMMGRSRFFPATDESGKAVPGTWESRMRWTLP